MRIIWRDQARSDLKEAIEYLRARNPSVALRTAQIIREKVRLLRTQPGLGRPGRVTDTRELIITSTPYLVIYTVDSRIGAVIVLRVLHGARLWPENTDDGNEIS